VIDRPAEFLINDTFSVPYVGAVVAGVVNAGTIRNGDTMWLVCLVLTGANWQGPNNSDDFVPITIRNIQRKRVNVPFVTAGQSASFALKKARRQDIRKGMVMLQKTDVPPQAVREFIAEGGGNFDDLANIQWQSCTIRQRLSPSTKLCSTSMPPPKPARSCRLPRWTKRHGPLASKRTMPRLKSYVLEIAA